MGKNIIIDCKTNVSKLNQYLYNNNLFGAGEDYKDSVFILDKEIEIWQIPLSAKNNLKTLKNFVEKIKKEDISGIIMSENVRKNEEISKFLSDNLKFFDGKNITDYFFEDIYHKYLALNNKKDYEAELVVFSDNAEKTYNFLNKICKKLKNVYIVSDDYNGFDEVIKKTYEEFGFYIYFTKKTGNVFLKDRIYINLSENTDFFLKEAEENNIIILNLSGKSILSKSMLNTFVFRISKEFKEVIKFFKYCDQECVEFLINSFKKNLSKEKIKEFIFEQNVNLKKICSKNYWQNKLYLL